LEREFYLMNCITKYAEKLYRVYIIENQTIVVYHTTE